MTELTPAAADEPASGVPVTQPTSGVPVTQPVTKTNSMAVASLVISMVGAIGLFCFGLGAIAGAVAAVLGTMAQRRIAETGESGAGVAKVGQIIGWIVFGLGALIATVSILLIVNGFQMIDNSR